MESFACVPEGARLGLIKALVAARGEDGLVPLSTVLRIKGEALELDHAGQDRLRKVFVRWGASAVMRGSRRYVTVDAALVLLFGLSPKDAAAALGMTQGALTGRVRPLLGRESFEPILADIGGEVARGVVGVMRRKAQSGKVGRYLVLVNDPRVGTLLEAEALELQAHALKAQAEDGEASAWERFGAVKARAQELRAALAPWELAESLSPAQPEALA